MATTSPQYLSLDVDENLQRLYAAGYQYLIIGRQLPPSVVNGPKGWLDPGDYLFREVIPLRSKPKEKLKPDWECYTMKEVTRKKLLANDAYSYQIAAALLAA